MEGQVETPAEATDSSQRRDPERQLLLPFLAELGGALSAIGETVDAVEHRLAAIARAFGPVCSNSPKPTPAPPTGFLRVQWTSIVAD